LPGSIPEGDNLFHPSHAYYHVDRGYEFQAAFPAQPIHIFRQKEKEG